MPWHFSCPTEISFGRGLRRELAHRSAAYGDRVLLVTGGSHFAKNGGLALLEDDLGTAGVSWEHVVVDHEPTDALVDHVTAVGRRHGAQVVLAVGGGSVLDAGKAAAAMLRNEGDCIDYLENLPNGKGHQQIQASMPLIAAPTTAGTGSEVTRNAVIHVPHFGLKRSMRANSMFPVQAVIDPGLIETCPHDVAAAAALDALAHLVESYLSTGATDLTDALSLRGIPMAVRFIRSLRDGDPSAADWDGMAFASLSGGMTLANARLGAAHGLVAPLCGRLSHIAHGHGVACLSGAALQVTHAALQERKPDSPAIGRMVELGALIADSEDVDQLVAALDRFRRELSLPALGKLGLEYDLLEDIAAKPSGSIASNPIELTLEERVAILTAARE